MQGMDEIETGATEEIEVAEKDEIETKAMDEIEARASDEIEEADPEADIKAHRVEAKVDGQLQQIGARVRGEMKDAQDKDAMQQEGKDMKSQEEKEEAKAHGEVAKMIKRRVVGMCTTLECRRHRQVRVRLLCQGP